MDRIKVSSESERLIAATKPGYERETTLCSPTRFSVATLSGIVVILTGTIFVLLAVPAPNVSCKHPDTPASETTSFLIGLVADVHLDLSPASCPNYDKSASQYGLFGCDATLALVNRTLASLAGSLENGTGDAVAVFFLGDAAKHQPLSTWDPRVTLASIQTAFRLLKQHFPRLSVLPTIGNNDLPDYYELSGTDYYERYNETWYSSLLRYYEPVITSDSTVQLAADFRDSFLEGGYYSVQLTNGITLVSLNTNIFATNVQDKVHQDTFAAAQLAWLRDTLDNTTGPVMIIGHHPPGLSLYSLYHNEAAKANWRLVYFEQFRAICSSVSDRITGLFFGHEHQDTFAVERDAETGQELAIFSIPSVSPVYQGQPSYSIAQLGRMKELVDLQTYHTWLDYYTRSGEELQFFRYKSLGDILGLEQLTLPRMLGAPEKIIDESDGLRTFTELKNRIYQERMVPIMPPHLYYCYSTSLHVSSFILCVEKFGYDGKMFVLNS